MFEQFVEFYVASGGQLLTKRFSYHGTAIIAAELDSAIDDAKR